MKYIHPINNFDIDFKAAVGENFSKLGQLSHLGLPSAYEFLITPNLFHLFVQHSLLDNKIEELIRTHNFSTPEAVSSGFKLISNAIYKSPLPPEPFSEVKTTLSKLIKQTVIKLELTLVYGYSGREVPHSLYPNSFAITANINDVENLIKNLWGQVFSPKLLKFYLEEGFEFSKLNPIISVSSLVTPEITIFSQSVPNSNKVEVWANWGLNPKIIKNEPLNLDKLNYFEIDAKTSAISKQKPIPNSESWAIVREGNSYQFKQSESGSSYISQLVNLVSEKLTSSQKIIDQNFAFKAMSTWVLIDRNLYLVNVEESGDRQLPASRHILTTGKMLIPGLITAPVVHIKSWPTEVNFSQQILILSELPNRLDLLKSAHGLIIEPSISDQRHFIRSINLPAIHEASSASKLIKPSHVVTLNATLGKVFKPLESASQIVIDLGSSTPTPISNIQLKPNYRTATALIADTTNINLIHNENLSLASGISFHPEEIISNNKVHPAFLEEKNQSELVNNLTITINETTSKIVGKAFFYNFSDLSTNILKHFKGGEQKEKDEVNPSAGLNGLTRIIHSSSFVVEEIVALKSSILKNHNRQVFLVIPKARTTSELIGFKKVLATNNIYNAGNIHFVATLATLENLFAVTKYANLGINQFVIDTDQIVANFYSLDLYNTELLTKVNVDEELIYELLEELILSFEQQNASFYLKLGGLLEEEGLINKAVHWGVRGIISANPSVELKKLISQAEFSLLQKRTA